MYVQNKFMFSIWLLVSAGGLSNVVSQRNRVVTKPTQVKRFVNISLFKGFHDLYVFLLRELPWPPILNDLGMVVSKHEATKERSTENGTVLAEPSPD